MMSLDIDTPRGVMSKHYEEIALRKFLSHFSDSEIVLTPKDKPATIDALISKNGIAVAGVEVKTRNMTLEQLHNWDDEWLVTFDKLDKGRVLCQQLGIDFYGFLYLIPEDALLYKRISDETGEWKAQFRTDKTLTQATINGGSIERINAFINMAGAGLLT